MLKSILSTEEFSGLTPEEILMKLNQKVVIYKNDTQQTMAVAASLLNDEEQEIVSSTLRTLSQQSAVIADYRELLLGPGLDWSSERFQAKLTEIANIAGWPENLLNKLKEIGIKYQYRYITMGLDNLPSIQEIQAALDEIKQENENNAKKSDLINYLVSKYNLLYNKIIEKQINTIEEIKNEFVKE